MNHYRVSARLLIQAIICCLLSFSCSESAPVVASGAPLPPPADDVTSPSTSGDSNNSNEDTGGVDGTSGTDGSTTSDGSDGVDATDTTEPCFCDDSNPCTKDECAPDGTCTYAPNNIEGCKPSLELFAPARGAVQANDAPFDVNGKAKSASNSAATVDVGGFSPPVNADGTFLTQVFPDHGLNIVKVTARDEFGNQASQSRGVLAGTEFYNTTNGPVDSALIPVAIGAWLGLEAWDDNDINDLDDFASIASLALSTLDLESLLPASLTGEGEGLDFAWCTWTVDVSGVQWNVDSVDLVPATGGLELSGTMKNLSAQVSATAPDFLCPDAIGSVNIDTVSVNAQLTVDLDANKTVLVDVAQINVSIVEPVVDLTGGVLSIFDFVFEWFDESFALILESAIESAVSNILAPTIQSALESFTVFETNFQLPEIPLIGFTPSFTVGVRPESLNFSNNGTAISLSARVTAAGGLPVDVTSPGSLARGDCMVGQKEAELLLGTDAPVSLGLHDDLLNQVLFAGWWSGALHRPIPGQYIVDRLGFEGINITSATLNPLSPPVATSCGPDGQLQLQIGDLGVEVELDLDGEPSQISAYVSTAADIVVSAVAGSTPATLDLAITVTQVRALEFDIITATGLLDGSEQLIGLLLEELVASVVDEIIGEGFGANFPVPTLDLGTLIPTIPAGSTIGFAPFSFSTGSGYTILEGALDGPANN